MDKSPIWREALWWAMVCKRSQAPLDQVLGASLGCAVWWTQQSGRDIGDAIVGAVPWTGGDVINVLTASTRTYGLLADIVFVHELSHVIRRHYRDGQLRYATEPDDVHEAESFEFVKAFLLKYDYSSKGPVRADDLYAAMSEFMPCDKEGFFKDVSQIDGLWRAMNGQDD